MVATVMGMMVVPLMMMMMLVVAIVVVVAVVVVVERSQKVQKGPIRPKIYFAKHTNMRIQASLCWLHRTLMRKMQVSHNTHQLQNYFCQEGKGEHSRG